MDARPLSQRFQDHGTADLIRIESTETGFELHVLADDGDWHIWNIHAEAMTLVEQVKQISAWWAEGQDAARTYVPPITEEDLEGYDRDDPKRMILRDQLDAQEARQP